MPSKTVTTGTDTWVVGPYPNATRNKGAYPVIASGTRRTLLHMPITLPSNAIVLSATLTCPARGTFPAQNVSVQALAGSWREDRATWNNQPGVTGTLVTTSVVDLLDGDDVELDVTAIAQAIANGQANYGWRISTDNTALSSFYGFDSGHESWTLDVEYADNPEAPAQLVPQGVISLAKWQVQIEDQDDLTQIKVQISPTANPVGAYDTGWVTVTEPVVNLARTDLPGGVYAGLADGATTYWRAFVKTVDGAESDPSEWAEVTRDVKPALVVSWPDPGISGTATVKSIRPVVSAHLSPAGDTSTVWRVRILADTKGTVLYDSGSIQGASLNFQIPRMWHGDTVLEQDTYYRFEVSVRDRPDRVGSYGDPTWIKQIIRTIVDSDSSEEIPSALEVSQPTEGSPDVLLRFTRAAMPDEFEVQRDGKTLPFAIDATETNVEPGVFEWIDVTATPNHNHTYRVRAVTNNNNSPWSVSDSLFLYVEGFWIRSGFGSVVLDGDDPVASIKKVDKRTTFNLLYNFEDVDIIGAVGGYAADGLEFSVDNRDPDEQDVDEAIRILNQIRTHMERPVQLVWGTVSIPAYLRALSVQPAPEIIPDGNRTHNVTFGFFQTADADAVGFGAAYYDVGIYG